MALNWGLGPIVLFHSCFPPTASSQEKEASSVLRANRKKLSIRALRRRTFIKQQLVVSPSSLNKKTPYVEQRLLVSPSSKEVEVLLREQKLQMEMKLGNGEATPA